MGNIYSMMTISTTEQSSRLGICRGQAFEWVICRSRQPFNFILALLLLNVFRERSSMSMNHLGWV